MFVTHYEFEEADCLPHIENGYTCDHPKAICSFCRCRLDREKRRGSGIAGEGA
jgi:hypothetical protein